jgi:hypothetical protein
MSFIPPARISDVEPESPSIRIASGPAYDRTRGLRAKFSVPERVIIVPSLMLSSCTNHPPIPMASPPIPPGFPRRSMMYPFASCADSTDFCSAPISRGGSKKTLKRKYSTFSGRRRDSICR